MAFIAEILQVRDEGLTHRVTYQFVDVFLPVGQQVIGPRVADRPVNEDHQAWANSIIPVNVDEAQLLADALAGNGDAVAFRDALVSERVEALIMDGSRFVKVTGTKTNERTIIAALTTRLGDTRVTRIRNKLRAAPYETMHILGDVERVVI